MCKVMMEMFFLLLCMNEWSSISYYKHFVIVLAKYVYCVLYKLYIN